MTPARMFLESGPSTPSAIPLYNATHTTVTDTANNGCCSISSLEKQVVSITKPEENLPLQRLCSLAPELIQTIADELNAQDIRNLRLACRYLSRTTTPAEFRTLTVNVSKSTVIHALAKLRTLASPGCPASYATRTLSIGSLSPCFDPTYSGPTWKCTEDGEWVAEEQHEDNQGQERALDEIRALILPAISSLKGLQNIKWNPIAQDDSATQYLVMDAICGAPNIRSLHLTLSHSQIPLSFDVFSHLQSISISGTSEKFHEEIFDSLARAIARSSHLTSLDITSNWRYFRGIDKTQSLNQLFKYCDLDAPLRLRHLGMHVGLVKLDDTTLPHLRHLTSLHLTNIEDPYTRARYTMEEDGSGDSSLLREQKEYGSSLADFWSSLHRSGVQLEDIELDVIVPSFVEYLASYTGVKRLHLTPGGFIEGSVSDDMAEAFFTRALPKHAMSLEDLNLNALYEGGWCFRPSNRLSVAGCRRLQTLRMSITESTETNNVADLIDTVCRTMPQLESIDIFASSAEDLRHAFCCSPIMSHLMHTTRAIETNVERYEQVPCSPLARLPKVTVSPDRSFVPRRMRKGTAEHDGWRYQSYTSFC